MSKVVIAVDPGWDKCGVAVGTKKRIYKQAVVPSRGMAPMVLKFANEYDVAAIAMGDCTCSKKAKETLKGFLPDIPIVLTNEWFSTMEARKLYFKANPPKGLWRLVPVSFRLPPRPVDDYAAVVILKRYFEDLENG